MCLLTDRIDREVLDAGTDLRIVANIAVGYNNIDRRGLPRARHRRHQHAGRAHQRVRGFHVGADPRHHAAAGRGRAAAPRRAVERMGAGSHARHRASGKRLGLVGVGRIGRAVAEKAPAFGMTVAYTARRRCHLPTPTTCRWIVCWPRLMSCPCTVR